MMVFSILSVLIKDVLPNSNLRLAFSSAQQRKQYTLSQSLNSQLHVSLLSYANLSLDEAVQVTS